MVGLADGYSTLDTPRPPLRWLGVVVRLSVLGVGRRDVKFRVETMF